MGINGKNPFTIMLLRHRDWTKLEGGKEGGREGERERERERKYGVGDGEEGG